MRIHIETETQGSLVEPKVGNVYPRRGGRSMKNGEMMILMHITDPSKIYCDKHAYPPGRSCLMLIIDRNGQPCGVDSYAYHYLEDKCPVAFCEGIEDIDLTLRSV